MYTKREYGEASRGHQAEVEMSDRRLDFAQCGPLKPPVPDATAVREQRDKILARKSFEKSERLKRFLHFVIEYSLKGRAQELKEYLIGTEVFDRKTTFDPR